jgi:thymidylate synthase
MYIKGQTIQYVWPKILYRIMQQPEVVLDERNSETKEILNLMWTITRPEESVVPEAYPLKEASMEVYKKQFLDPNRYTFVYTYGNRLRKEFGIDQIDEALKRLQNSDTTRRATMVTFNPMTDFKSDEIPCFIMGDFKIRKGLLYTTGVWRSHDAYGAIPANFFALLEMSKMAAEATDTDVGPITVQSISAHVYKINWGDAKRAAKFMG